MLVINDDLNVWSSRPLSTFGRIWHRNSKPYFAKTRRQFDRNLPFSKIINETQTSERPHHYHFTVSSTSPIIVTESTHSFGILYVLLLYGIRQCSSIYFVFLSWKCKIDGWRTRKKRERAIKCLPKKIEKDAKASKMSVMYHAPNKNQPYSSYHHQSPQ